MYVKEHNKIAYNKIKEGFQVSNKVATICATGTGKSYQALQLIADNLDSKILYLTSLKSIKEQFIALCKKELSCEVETATYDGLTSERLMQTNWDYIILDEFHRGGADVWGTNLAALIRNNPHAKYLGLSATPIRYLDDMRNMADELFEGNVVYELSLAQAIAKGILPIPEYISCLYSFDEINQKISKYEDQLANSKRIKDVEAAKNLIAQAKALVASSPDIRTVLKKSIHDVQGHYIVFCSDTAQLKSLQEKASELFAEINDITIYSIYSAKKGSKRELNAFLKDNSAKLKLLFAINMISEGIHAENITGVIFLRPTASPNVYLQQMGRALSSGKKGRPQVIDMVNNTDCLKLSINLAEEVNEIIRQANYFGTDPFEFSIIDYVRKIEEVLEAVEDILYWGWNEWYDLAKAYHQKYGNLLIRGRYITEDGHALGEWIKLQRKDYRNGTIKKKHEQALNTLGIQWDPMQDYWDDGFYHAEQYLKEHGDLLVPRDYICNDGYNLGIWIYNKRQNLKKGVLTDSQKKQLDSIGMTWSIPDDQWNASYELAKQYFEEHGNLKVPRQYVTDTGMKLGMWISDRRRNYQKGMLSEDQVHRLEQIGMIWNVVDNSWEAGLEEATLYYQQFGNLVVNREYITPNNFKLGKWISHMREKYKKDKLTQEQIQQLNEVGMIWDRLLVRTRASKLKTTDIVDPHEVENSQCYVEGATKHVVVNAFERDKTARSKCLKFYKEKDGCIKCQLCGFNFGTFYGEKCNDMIEVHHIKPLSTIREEYSIDPQKDLLPLCPNCHYVVHAAFGGDIELLKNHLEGKPTDTPFSQSK